MKKLLVSLLLLTSLPVTADPLDEALKKYSAMNEGRVRFHIVPATGEAQDATLVFRRPDRLHFWEQGGGGPETHIWLESDKMWFWTSQWTPDEQAQKNVYMVEPHEGPLTDVAPIPPFGPALFVIELLGGQREDLHLDPRRRSGYYTKDGDQLLFDPQTHLLREIVAYRNDKIVARAKVTTEMAVPSSELGWKLPTGAKPVEDAPAEQK